MERELRETQALLEEREKDLVTAAELGKKLLESNHELNARLEESAREWAARTEVCVLAMEKELCALLEQREC